MHDPYDLQRFVEAQTEIFEQARSELQAGRKCGHWIWFVFPQMKGLGHSEMATFYGLGSREEAEAYLNHPVLGSRLRDCCQLVTNVAGRSANEILGYPDDLKFRSSLSLFALVSPQDPVFRAALDKYFHGKLDQRTVELLESSPK